MIEIIFSLTTWPISTKLHRIVWWTSFKIVQRFKFHQELWLLWHQKRGKLPNLKKYSCLKVLARFEKYFPQMFLGVPSTKIVQIFLIRWKTWLPGGGAYFPYMCIVKTLKIFLSKSTGPIWKLFCTNVHWGTFTKIVQIFSIRWKTWPPGGGDCFPYMRIVKT